MSEQENSERRANAYGKILDRLHNPVHLRICLTVAVLLIGYGAVYMPLDDQITDTTRKLQEGHKRLELAGEIERLRSEFDEIKDRLPHQTDSKQWVQYVLEGIRQYPLKLISLDCDAPRDVGPYKAVVLRIQLAGTFADLDRFLHWVEANQRLFRADEVKIAPMLGDQEGVQTMQLTVLGVMG